MLSRSVPLLGLLISTSAWAADDTARSYAGIESAKKITIADFDGTIPQFVDGDGWQTTIILTNLYTVPVYYQINFKSNSGAAQNFNFVGLGSLNTVTGTLAVGETAEIATTGTSNTLTEGYGRMFNFTGNPAQGGALTESRAGGFAIFRRRLPGLPDQEAVVPISDPFEQHFTIPFDNRNGFLSGVAIVNDTTQSGTLTVIGRDYAGTILLNETASLAAGIKQVYLVKDKYPALAGKAGTLTYSINTIGLTGLGLRFNPGGSFTSTHPVRY